MRNWQTHFAYSGLATALVLGLLPSLWDSVSDFAFAKEEDTEESLGTIGFSSAATVTTYFFISLPFYVTAVTWLQKMLVMIATKCCSCFSQNLLHLLSFATVAWLGAALVVPLFLFPSFFYLTAVLSTFMVLSVKVVAILVHGPELKKLSTRMTSLESQYESSLQLMLVLVICFTTGEFTLTKANSLFSGVVMIGKSGAECYLTFGNQNLLEQTGPEEQKKSSLIDKVKGGLRGLLNKLKILAAYSPVFIATAASRLTTMAVVLQYTLFTYTQVLVYLPLSLVAPSTILFIAKSKALKDLSAVDLVKAVIGEMTTHTLWGGRGREGSRKLQLFMQVYFLLLHSFCMVLVLLGSLPVLPCNVEVQYCTLDGARFERLRIGAIISLSTGWLPRLVLTPL